jgi:hypothetical protein
MGRECDFHVLSILETKSGKCFFLFFFSLSKWIPWALTVDGFSSHWRHLKKKNLKWESFFTFFFSKEIFTLKNATFRKIVPWMTTGLISFPAFLCVGGGGSRGRCGAEEDGGCVQGNLLTHQPNRILEFTVIHSFTRSFTYSVNQQTHIEGLPSTKS